MLCRTEFSNHAGVNKKYYSAIFRLLEAAFKIHLAQKSERAQIISFEPVIQRAY